MFVIYFDILFAYFMMRVGKIKNKQKRVVFQRCMRYIWLTILFFSYDSYHNSVHHGKLLICEWL